MRLHIDVNGNPAPCKASVKACPRDEHFDSMRDAQVFLAREAFAKASGRHENAMTHDEAYGLTRKLLDEHGLSSVNVVFDNASKRLGCCKFMRNYRGEFVPIQISLSRRWVDAADRSKTEDTIRHEVAHAIAGHLADHGPEWQKQAVALGATPKSHADARDDDKRGNLYPWVAVCPQCGNTIRRASAPTQVYACSACSDGQGWSVSRVFVMLKNGVEVPPSQVGKAYARAWASIEVRYADELAAIEQARQEAATDGSQGYVKTMNGDCHYYGSWRRLAPSGPDPEFIEALSKMYVAKFGTRPEDDGIDAGQLLAMFNKGELA